MLPAQDATSKEGPSWLQGEGHSPWRTSLDRRSPGTYMPPGAGRTSPMSNAADVGERWVRPRPAANPAEPCESLLVSQGATRDVPPAGHYPQPWRCVTSPSLLPQPQRHGGLEGLQGGR